MNIALLGDIHGNAVALEAVLAKARANRCDEVWNLGDQLGYGPDPAGVIDRLAGLDRARNLLGNYDAKALRLAEKSRPDDRPRSPAKYFAFLWACHQLSPGQRRWIEALPAEQVVEVAGWRILLTHHTISGQPLVDLAPAETARLARAMGLDAVFHAHTHAPADEAVDGVRLVNPGSVGRPEGGDPRVAWASVTIGRDGIDVTQHRLAYDAEATAEAIRAKGLPEAFAQMILRGHNLQDVMARWHPRRCELGDDYRLAAARQFAEACHYERAHAEQVERLSLLLFDGLFELHGLGDEHRRLMQIAAICHDIGWLDGQRKHHKVSARLIRSAAAIPLDDRQREIVACIARYHRKALPKADHRALAALQEGDRNAVELLAGMVRLADGLDRSHRSVVESLTVDIEPTSIDINATTHQSAREESCGGTKKADLLARALGREIDVSCHHPSCCPEESCHG